MKRFSRLPFVFSLVFIASGCDNGGGSTPPDPIVPSVHRAFVTDDQGRALILHGLNVSSSAKDHPQRMPWIDREQALRISRDWGFNGVRFLIFWDAVEPAPGVYDEAYLDRVAERVDWLGEAGIHVILDMHQDVYGKFGIDGRPLGFDGAPSWAARTDGLPHRIAEPWALTYIQQGVRRAFDNFWDDQGTNADLQQHYAAMWAHVAARFADHPAVIGYDLMNEPYAGSAAAGNLAGIPFGNAAASAAFQTGPFHRFNQRMVDAIRAVDEDSWIFFEPLAFAVNSGGASELPPLDDPRDGDPRLVYYPHLYSVGAEVSNFFDPDNDPEVDAWVAQAPHDMEKYDAPMMVGEFGFPWRGNGNPLGYLDRLLDHFDDLASGWMYWSHDIGGWSLVEGPDLHENPNVDVLVRAFPQRVAGFPVEYGYDAETRGMHLIFADRAAARGPTEIYIPAQRHYPDGWVVEVDDPNGTWSSEWDAEREILSVTTRKTGSVHEIRIRPAM
jgi:endoglycosylceramidase